ncbi:pilus assembly PilX N-terminal domain-containing protein [SCandidatus Aminicenantes bacterium Aminicenantia_JdfR_composite]|jgi:hypothetical protein|nr:pilus assembly PilX N-terminal domain-containing protein [SCandidatus Aminicenantes bacterium Aminicenantia_JdfR_composite]MCP2596286.1 pilus assembly PilX N-terminal domain-containing protein [Candidatus Aminicenantes bacterium AC-335-G13]MCP2597861.1 pilus assembly PilX N-terminal domain-containing protein [Candidatus Aminicenantes bacterium AC-335-L06]MCP2605600.1 pilus assembly PilX N-terminal domain-containing protein [Candidatus Aminicenantes bacterium AC-335-O07]MCP2620482.1 pilus ass
MKNKGSALIIAILMIAFLASAGILLILVTTTGPRVASNIRLQEEAFNAAEAGFDAAWAVIENFFETEQWASFDGHYLTTDKNGNNIDTPWINGEVNPYYFRRLSDEELLNALEGLQPEPTTPGLIFNRQTFIQDNQNYTYTVFLIDDEAGSGTSDPTDALLVCIGTGPGNTTKRLEIEIYVEIQS